MSDAVVIAVLGFLGTVFGTLGVMLIKRRFDVADRRDQERVDDERRCDRLAQIYPQMLYHLRQREMQIMALSGLCDTRPDYVLARIREIASEPNRIKEWQEFVDPPGGG